MKLSVEERGALVRARQVKRQTGVDGTQKTSLNKLVTIRPQIVTALPVAKPLRKRARKRKARHTRAGEVVCICPAYKFPHRQLGGRCTPQRWVCRYFSPTKRECKDCLNLNGSNCEVLTGQEQPMHCPELRDYIRFEGIALYGRARDLLLRAQRRKAEREVA